MRLKSQTLGGGRFASIPWRLLRQLNGKAGGYHGDVERLNHSIQRRRDVFDSMEGQHDKGANFDVYLKGHAGDPIMVDRIGRKLNHILNPRLPMMLTIQPRP